MTVLRNMNISDLGAVKALLARAFVKQKLRKDARLPVCRSSFLQMYLSDCPEACFVVVDDKHIKGAGFGHIWGHLGWIGPLAVSPDIKAKGVGKEILERMINVLQMRRCTTIGLETNPRIFYNIGFYGKLDLKPQTICVDLMCKTNSLKLPDVKTYYILFSKCSPEEKKDFITQVSKIAIRLNLNVDYSRLINLIYVYEYGESVLFFSDNDPFAFASLQTKSALIGETVAVARCLSFLAVQTHARDDFLAMLHVLCNLSKEQNLQLLIIRIPSYHSELFIRLLKIGFRVVNTELRMTLHKFEELLPVEGIHLCKWE